ncbi:hypothetical protein CDL15_Pgr007854 [Punica granatum]|uniref:Uncharacterized protein n=1 Tax=Punica granatum TaxID=22663 RepID=A0A218XAT9_PUNGR|nr:hypothetical protein CDL15_Pgr007854 [Punica granatum]
MYQLNKAPHLGSMEGRMEVCDAKTLDKLTTSRGELKVRTMSCGEYRSGPSVTRKIRQSDLSLGSCGPLTVSIVITIQ